MTLEDISADRLREVLAEVDDSSATERVMAALTYKGIDGMTQEDVANLYGYSEGWVSKWFNRLERLEDEPTEEVVHDDRRPGRPPKLTDHQHEQFVETVHTHPNEAGVEASDWTVPVARRYLREEFDVTFSERHVRRLLSEIGVF